MNILAKQLLLTVFLAAFAQSIRAQAPPPAFDWVRMYGTDGYERCYSVAVDSCGAAYSCGHTTGSFDGYQNQGGHDAFLIKHDAHGQPEWCAQWGGPLNDFANGVAVDSCGDVIVVTKLEIRSGQTWQGYIRKWNGQGELLWEHKVLANEGVVPISVRVDSRRNIYVVGEVYDSASSRRLNFVQKRDRHGIHCWTRYLGPAIQGSIADMAIDRWGNIAVCGSVQGDLNGEVNSGRTDAFVFKLNCCGSVLWTRLWGFPENDRARGIAFDEMTSDIVVVGGSEQPTEPPVAPPLYPSVFAPNNPAFVVRYSSDGFRIRERLLSLRQDATDVEIDRFGRINVVGFGYAVGLDPESQDIDWFLNMPFFTSSVAVNCDGAIFIGSSSPWQFRDQRPEGERDGIIIRLK